MGALFLTWCLGPSRPDQEFEERLRWWWRSGVLCRGRGSGWPEGFSIEPDCIL